MQEDTIRIEILEDGTVKVTTDSVSAPNHMNAEQFITFMATMLGGATSRVKRGDRNAHARAHDHSREDHKH